MKVTDYLNLIQKKHGLTSDYQLSKRLGVTRQAVSHWRRYQDTFSDEISLKVADLLEMHSGEVLVDMHIQRAKRPEEKKAWRDLLKQLTSTAAALVLVLQGLVGSPVDAIASPAPVSVSGQCILCKIGRRRWWQRLADAWDALFPDIAACF